MNNITKVEYRELTRNVSYLRRMAEEIIDECCSFEADIQELYDKGKHRAKGQIADCSDTIGRDCA